LDSTDSTLWYPIPGPGFLITYQGILDSKVVEFQILTLVVSAYDCMISGMLPVCTYLCQKNGQVGILTFAIVVLFFAFRVRISRVWLTDKFMINANCKGSLINSMARIHLIIVNGKKFPRCLLFLIYF